VTSAGAEPGRLKNAVWIVWLTAAASATFPLFLWHVQYFQRPGTKFFTLLLIALCAVTAGLPLYHRLRQRGLWRYELAVLAGLPLLAGLIYETRGTLTTLWMFISACALGRWVLERAGLKTSNGLEEIVLAAGIGLGVLACALFALGLAGAFYPWAFAVLLTAICLIFFRCIPPLWTAIGSLRRQWGVTEEFRSGLGTVLIVFAVLFAVCGVMVMLAPSVAYDVLSYHLIEVRAYSDQHALRPLPWLDASYRPQSTELWMTLAYSLGGQPAAQMAPPIFFVLTLLMLFAIARHSGAGALGSLAGAVFAGTIPFLHWTGSVAKDDVALAFFLLAALYAYLRWRETGKFAWIQVGVFFLAIAAGVKEIAIFAVPPFAVFFALAAWRQPRRLRTFASLALIFTVFGLFWYVRDFSLTGNPVHPWKLATAISPHRRLEWGAAALRFVQLPWRMHFSGQRFFESLLPNPLGIFFVLFAPVWLMVRRRTDAITLERTCLLFTAAYVAYWATMLATLRFGITPIVILAVFTGGRLAALYQNSPAWMNRVLLGACVYCLWFALLAAAIVEINAPQFQLFAGKIDKAGYLRQALGTYPSLEYLKTQVAPGDRVLGVENCSAAYAPDPAAFDCFWPSRGPEYWREIKDRLGQSRFQFLIVPAGQVDAGAPPDLDDATLLYRDAAFCLYRLAGN